MKGRVAVTPRSLSESGHPALALLAARGYEMVFPAPGRLPTEEELIEALPGCVGYLAGVEPVTQRVLQASRDLKVISRNGVGVDNIDISAAEELGIRIEKAVGANARGVAELALGLTFCALRSISWSDRQMAAGLWKRRKGREVLGKTLGIVGCGAIGRTLGQMAIGLGMKVVGYDPFLRDAAAAGFPLASLGEVLASADVVSLHCPPGDQPIISAATLSELKRGAVLVNTARAELVDESALLVALNNGQVAVYATDVYRSEPPDPSALLQHENVIRTPHAGGFTDESVDRATQVAVENLIRGLEGEERH